MTPLEEECLDMSSDPRRDKMNWPLTFIAVMLMVLGTGTSFLTTYAWGNQFNYGLAAGFLLAVAGFIWTIFDYVRYRRKERAGES